MPKRLLTVPEAGLELGMSEKWLWAKISRREIPVVRLGRSVRLLQSTIDELIADSTTPAISDSAPLRSYRRGAAGRRRSGPVPIDDVRDGTG
jgi:predicted DNA-binding transcriptional regulator AlpA